MKKILSIILTISMLFVLTACDASEDELYGLYRSDDNVVNTDIGEYIIGNTAPLLTEGQMCYFTQFDESVDPLLDCYAALVIDLTDNKLLFAENSFEHVYPASITKLLAALVVLRNGNLEDVVTISEDDCGITEEGAQLIGFKKGDKITVEDLLYCLLVYSGNDSAIALGEYIAGSEAEFVEMMNKEAKRLGCIDTNYLNPHGLHDKEHFTSAYDEYIILKECMKYEIFREINKSVDFDLTYESVDGVTVNKSFHTTNKYKSGVYKMPDGITLLGGKTGNTFTAGVCLIIQVADKEGKEYVVALFGAKDNNSLYGQMTYLMGKFINNDSSYDKPIVLD